MLGMANQEFKPAYIKQRLEKAKYKTGGRIGVRVAYIRAKGETRTEVGVETTHELYLEMGQVSGVWGPVPPAGDDFTSTPSILRSESNGCYTRAYIRNFEDLQRVLIRLGAIPAPTESETPAKRGWRPRRPAYYGVAADKKQYTKSTTGVKNGGKLKKKKGTVAAKKTVKKTVKKKSTTPGSAVTVRRDRTLAKRGTKTLRKSRST